MKRTYVTSLSVLILSCAQAQVLDGSKIKHYETALQDVMELIDTTEVKLKLTQVEDAVLREPTELNKVRLGIIYHETALNLGFLTKTRNKGYSKRSYDLLSELCLNKQTTQELLPFISAYRASALSLQGAETMKMSLVGDAFKLFDESVKLYSAYCSAPEFLRASVAENLPWFFFSFKKFAKKDMQSILDKQERQGDFAPAGTLSFVYWAWANQHQAKKDRVRALSYLDQAIALDPGYKAGRTRAEALRARLSR